MVLWALQSWIVDGVEKNLVDVSVCPEAAWASCMEDPKSTTCCCFLLLRCSGELLLKDFLATEVF